MFYDLEKGLTRIQDEDRQSQLHFLEVIIADRYSEFVPNSEDKSRKIKELFGESIQKTVDYLLSLKCFFVPNNDYMVYYFGKEVLDSSVDCYNSSGNCKWLGHLVIPIRGALNCLEGFTGYNPLNRTISYDNKIKGEDNPVPPKYIISSSRVFDKDTHLLIPNGYKKMLTEDYAIVVDGVFDGISVGMQDYNSVVVLGSFLNDKTTFALSMLSKVFVPYDNDEAGLKLFRAIKRVIPRAVAVQQHNTKDLDNYFKINGFTKFQTCINNALQSKFVEDISL